MRSAIERTRGRKEIIRNKEPNEKKEETRHARGPENQQRPDREDLRKQKKGRTRRQHGGIAETWKPDQQTVEKEDERQEGRKWTETRRKATKQKQSERRSMRGRARGRRARETWKETEGGQTARQE